MHLMTKNTKNNSYYYAVESFRDGKKTSTRIVKSFGSGAQLAAQGIDDPKRYCTERIAEMNASLKDNRKTVESEFDFSTTLKEEGDYSRSKAINLGWKFAADYFDRLGLPELFREKAGREKYDVGAITRFVVASRMIAPCSKIRILSALENYYDAPEIRDKNAIYRAIEKVDAISDDIQACVYRNMKDMASLDTSALIVDCTNSFFETPLQDDDVVDQEGNVIEKGLRKYGASKEHRPNPIVQIALFADLNGVPISYSIDSGNTNEQKMVIPLEGRMIRDFNKHSFIYCSDGGLGSFENRFFNTLQNRNYVVTQSLKKTPDDELKLILADKNWNMIGQYETKDGKKTYHEGTAVSLEEFRKICDRKYEGKELTEEERKLLEKDRIYKKYPITRKVDIMNLLAQKSSGTVEMLSLPEKPARQAGGPGGGTSGKGRRQEKERAQRRDQTHRYDCRHQPGRGRRYEGEQHGREEDRGGKEIPWFLCPGDKPGHGCAGDSEDQRKQMEDRGNLPHHEEQLRPQAFLLLEGNIG